MWLMFVAYVVLFNISVCSKQYEQQILKLLGICNNKAIIPKFRS
jgi:hypothetical protein